MILFSSFQQKYKKKENGIMSIFSPVNNHLKTNLTIFLCVPYICKFVLYTLTYIHDDAYNMLPLSWLVDFIL